MELHKFDSTLKSALENLDVPYDSGTWAALESRLDALPGPEAMDKTIRPSLEQIDVPYDPGSWSLLAGKMDRIVRVRKLWLTKLAEAAIFLLLLLNLKGFFGVVESVTKPAPVIKENYGPIAKETRKQARKQSLAADVSTQDANLFQDQSIAEQLASFVQSVANSFTQSIDNELETQVAPAMQPMAANLTLLDPSLFYTQAGKVHFEDKFNLPGLPAQPVLFAGSTIAIQGIGLPKVALQSRFYGATFVSLDQNHAQENGFSDKQYGYGGGLAVGYRNGKWGLETGLVYSSKNYQPKRDNVEYQNDPFNGISYRYVNEVDADVISVPVKATRCIAKLGSTTAHAVAGVTTHFAASKRYEYETVHFPPPIPQPNPNPVPPNMAAFPEGNGVLENGGLTQNVYASADLGLRLEQPIGKRYIAFVEPLYRQSLTGSLGPNSARINTFSIQAGVMASL